MCDFTEATTALKQLSHKLDHNVLYLVSQTGKSFKQTFCSGPLKFIFENMLQFIFTIKVFQYFQILGLGTEIIQISLPPLVPPFCKD